MKTVILVLAIMVCIGQSDLAMSYKLTYENKAKKLYSEGKYELSLIFFEKAFKEDPTNPRINFYLGNLYNHKRSFDKSIVAFKRGLENASSEEEKLSLLYNIARTYQANKQYENALIFYDKVDKSSLQRDAFFHKGMIFFKLQDKEQTINEWENYLANAGLSPEYDSVHKAIGVLKQKDFKWDKVSTKDVREEDKAIVEDIGEPKAKPLSDEEIKEAESKLVKELKNRETDETEKTADKETEKATEKTADKVVEEVVEEEVSKVKLEKDNNIKLSDHLDRKEDDYEDIER